MFYRMKLEWYSRGKRYRRPAPNPERIVVLPPARQMPPAKPQRDNSAKIKGWADGLTQQWMLKMKLKVHRRTRAVRKERPQMLHGLK